MYEPISAKYKININLKQDATTEPDILGDGGESNFTITFYQKNWSTINLSMQMVYSNNTSDQHVILLVL